MLIRESNNLNAADGLDILVLSSRLSVADLSLN